MNKKIEEIIEIEKQALALSEAAHPGGRKLPAQALDEAHLA